MANEKKDAGPDEKDDANALIAGGVGIGVIGAAAAAVGGALCPVCVVAAPLLVGVGAYKRWRHQKEKAES